MNESPQRVSSVVRVDVSGPYLQGVAMVEPKLEPGDWPKCWQWTWGTLVGESAFVGTLAN